jgi:hypothetical protein
VSDEVMKAITAELQAPLYSIHPEWLIHGSEVVVAVF